MKTVTKNTTTCFTRWSRKGYGVLASFHRCVKIGVLSVSMSIVLLSSDIASAQSASDTLSVLKTVRIDDVGVVGNKQTPTRSAMLQTPIFDRVSEAAAPIQTLESALRLSPAIDLRERGGKGVQADISIRGGSFDQTMVMLNGINFTDARTGHQTHSLPIDVDCISGVELIDGVSGVGAYAGAINIRTAPLRPRYLRFEATGGEWGYGYGNLSGAYTSGRFSLFGAASYRRSDGYIHNTDFANYNGYVRMNYDSRRAGFFDLQVGYQNREFGANGFYSLKYLDQAEQTSTYLASLRWVKSIGRFVINSDVSYRKNFDRFELVKDNPTKVPFNYHNTDNVGAELWVDYNSAAGTTSLGGDYTYNHIWSTVLGELQSEPNGRYTKSKARSVGNIWLRHVKHFDRFDIAASLGVSTTPYGTTALWSASGGWRPVEGLKFELGATQSMRLPTFNDLYYTATGYVGNSSLKPEKAITYRFTARYGKGNWSSSATAYYRDGKDIIDWVRASADDDWHSMQITSLGTYGIELGGAYRTEGFLRRLSLNYGYISMDKSSGGMISKYALDYMRHKLAAAGEVHLLRNFSFALTGTLYNRRGNYTDATAVAKPYGSYFLLDGRLAWTKGVVRLYVDASNLTGTDYFDYGGLQMPGRWFSGGIVITL